MIVIFPSFRQPICDIHSNYSVLVGENTIVFGNKASEMNEDEDDDVENEKGAAIFSSSWLPGGESRYIPLLTSLSRMSLHMPISLHMFP